MPRNELLQFGHQLARPTERELCVDPFLERGKASLFQVRRLGGNEWLVGEIIQRRAAPEAERLA